MQDPTVQGLDTSTTWHHRAQGKKIRRSPEGILVTDLGGDTWREDIKSTCSVFQRWEIQVVVSCGWPMKNLWSPKEVDMDHPLVRTLWNIDLRLGEITFRRSGKFVEREFWRNCWSPKTKSESCWLRLVVIDVNPWRKTHSTKAWVMDPIVFDVNMTHYFFVMVDNK